MITKNKLLIKKLMFSGITIPLGYKTVWAWKWQARRKIEKQKLVDDRLDKLSQETVTLGDDIEADVPINRQSKEEFDKEWLYKPVKIKGIFDHSKETMI